MKRILVVIPVCFCMYLSFAADLMAPETTEQDVFGYETYSIHENGAIRTRSGELKGWIRGNEVYDTQWSFKYSVTGYEPDRRSPKARNRTGKERGGGRTGATACNMRPPEDRPTLLPRFESP